MVEQKLKESEIVEVIIEKIIRQKTSGGSQEDNIRRLLYYCAEEKSIQSLFLLSEQEVKKLKKRNYTDIEEVEKVIKFFFAEQEDIYDFQGLDVKTMLAKSYDLSEDDINFIATVGIYN